MLQFLPLALTALSTLSSLKNNSKPKEQTQAERAQIQAMVNRDRLLKAMLNPDDVINKNLTSQESQFLNANTQQQLSNLLSANRRAQLMGRQSYFNPERQDEAISQFLTKQSDYNANTARSNALQRIMDTANGYTGQASSYGGMIQNQQAAQNQEAQRQPSNFAALGNIAGVVGGMFGGGGGSMSNIFSSMANNNQWLNPDTGRYQ